MATGSVSDLTFLSRQMNMFKNLFRSMTATSRQQKGAGDALSSASRALRRVLGSVTRRELRQEFSRLGDDLKNYQKMLHKYNIQNEEDLQRLIRVGKRFYDNEDDVKKMQDNFNRALQDMKENAEHTGSLMQGALAFELSNIRDRIDDNARSALDMSNEVIKAAGLTSKQMEDIRKYLADETEMLNELSGNKFNFNDMMQSLERGATEYKIVDPELLKAFAKYSTLLLKTTKATEDSTGQVLDELTKKGFSVDQLEEFTNKFVNAMQGFKIEDDKVMQAISTLKDLTFTSTKGDTNEMMRLNESIIRATALMEDSNINSEDFMETFRDAVLNRDPEAITKLTNQLAQSGMSINDAMEAFQTGNFDKFVVEYIKSVGRIMENTAESNRGVVADLFGIERSQVQKFINSVDHVDEKLEGLSKNMEEGAGAVANAKEQYVSLFDSIQNWASTITIFGKDLGSIIDSIGMSPLEAFAAWQIGKDMFSGLGKSGGKLIEVFKKGSGLGGKLKDFGTTVLDVSKKAGTLALSLGGSLLSGIKTLAITLWTQVIPALIAFGKNLWSKAGNIFDKLLGRGGKKGLGDVGKGVTTKGLADDVAKAAKNTAGEVAEGASKLGKLGSVVTKSAAPLALAAGAYDILTSDNKSEAILSTAGSAAGGWAGATAGAALGTALLPGVGTVLGGVLGGIAGALGGDWVSEKVNKFLEDLDIPFFEKGTNYVPEDGLAYLHKGEAVIPEKYNPSAGYKPEFPGISEVQDLREISRRSNQIESQRSMDKAASTREEDRTVIVDQEQVVAAIKALTDFMKFWYQDEVDRERRQQRKTDPFAIQREVITNWGV